MSDLFRSVSPSKARVNSNGGRRPLLLAAGIILAIGAAFSNSLSGQFVYDDLQQVDTNQLLGHWDQLTIVRILTHDIKSTLRQDLPGGRAYSNYYRPAFILYLMIVYELAGHSAFWWHCSSVILHMLASVVAFLLLRKILSQASEIDARRRDWVAFFAALVFAVHPVQCESVSWISGSVNSIAALLGFASFYAYLAFKQSLRSSGAIRGRAIGQLAATGILYGCAALAKESALAVPLLIAGHEFFVFPSSANVAAADGGRNRRATWLPLLAASPFAIVSASYLLIRLRVLGGLTGAAGLSTTGFVEMTRALLTLPALMIRYGELMAFPFRLSVNYDFARVATASVGTFWLPLMLLSASSLLALRLWRRSRLWRVGLLWLIVPLLPHLNSAFFSSEETIHDRYLYLSTLGAGIVISLAINAAMALPAPAWRRYSPALAAALIVCLCALTFSQNSVWRNNKTLWSNAERRAPNSRIVHFWLGSIAETDQDLEEAARQYSFALGADPSCVDCFNNLAFVYAHQGRWNDSIQVFEQVVSLTPEHSIAHFNLSFAYAVARRYRDALREQRLALELDPDSPRSDEWRSRERQLEALAQSADAPVPRGAGS